jgi:N-acetylglucosamine malate deacetylase 1
MNILMISAHPDDMEIGMGGTAAKLAESGSILTSVVLTDGRRSANPFALTPEALATRRKEEAQKAANILGINQVLFCNLPELKSTQYYDSAKKQMTEIIEQSSPDEIYILHPDLDRHASHQLAGKVSLEALRKSSNKKNITVWAYEVWGLFNRWDRFEDISSVVGKKLQAISEHRSQVACVPYAEGVTGLNRWRAIFADPQQETINAAFAEVFIRLSVNESAGTGFIEPASTS